ncbi:PaaI family thioesterase [Salinisphaera hydrothermalis]|uniref:PaaI family thioesterase n=1 Tax=Salinisphaera hydrothermalis TaxID=563188 RepID=UPI003342BE40
MTIDEQFEIGQQALKAQAFSQLVGAELTAFDAGHVTLEIPIRDDLLQQNGFVHGGVLSYAADNALTFVGGSMLGHNVLTSEYKINYLKPGVGDRLVARGSVVYVGKRQAVCRCDVYAISEGKADTLCATAQGTIVAFEPASTQRS